jgi:hypothetical protein
MLQRPRLNHLLLLMFGQQVVFAFESLLGYSSSAGSVYWDRAASGFHMSVLVYVQALIGRWSRKYGERRLVFVR